METLSLTIHVDASPAVVWHVLEDFGSIDRWSPGIKSSRMLTEGPVGIGSTRRCDFKPFGSASERIEEFVPHERLRVILTDISMMPLETAEASFVLSPAPSGTDVAFEYSFRRKGFSRLLGGLFPKMLESGLGPLLAGLKAYAEGVHESPTPVREDLMSQPTPLSDLMKVLQETRSAESRLRFVRAFEAAEVGVRVLGAPPGTTGRVRSDDSMRMPYGATPDGRPGILAIADPFAFAERYGPIFNAVVHGSVLLDMLAADPEGAQRIIVNSAAEETGVLIEPEDLVLRRAGEP